MRVSRTRALAVQAELHGAAVADRLVELRDLNVLREVRIEVVLAREAAALADLAADRQPQRTAASTTARFSTGSAPAAQAHRIGVGVGLGAERRRRPGEDLRLRRELHVHLEADDDLVIGPGSRRASGGSCSCHFVRAS
jgi:hypothetical protein